jgi:hypothetical protein
MARRKKSRRRRDTSIKLLNIMEAYAYADIGSRGIMGASPWEVITGGSSVGTSKVYDSGLGLTSMVSTGVGSEVTLTEILQHPDMAFSAMQSNAMANWQAMVIGSLGVSIGFKLGKKLMRRPIANVNRNIFKPLGIGVKL